MNFDSLHQQWLICVALIDRPEDAATFTEVRFANGLNAIEVTFHRADAAAMQAIATA